MERRREQGAEGFVGLCFEIVLFCQREAKCPFKSMWHHPCCAGGLWAGRGTPAPLLCHPLCLSCPSLPVIVAWFALTPHDGPIVVTHPGALSSSFKGTRGEPEVTACHSAPSELAINMLACPQGSEKPTEWLSGWDTLPAPAWPLPGCIPEIIPPALTLGLFNHCHFSGDQTKLAITTLCDGHFAWAEQPRGF